MQALTRRGNGEQESESDLKPSSEGDTEATAVVDLREGDDRPVDAVFDALEARSEGDDLLVLASMAPIPLYDRLEERGWSYEAVRSDADEWRIHVTADSEDRSGERLRRPRRRRHE
ncbi:MAG: DUF2249 domain-containing protein [Natronomonas sp.]